MVALNSGKTSHRLPLVLEGQVAIDCSPAVVFDYVSDLENYPRWFPGIGKMRAVNRSPIGTIGKRYDEIAYLPGANIKSIAVEIVEFVPGEHFAMHADLDPIFPRFDYTVVPDGEGGTIFRWRCHRRGRGVKAAIGEKLMRTALKPRLKKALEALKLRVECRADTLMKASVMRRFGAADDVIELDVAVPKPRPGRSEVLVRVTASSLNRIDIARRAGYGRVLLDVRGASGFPMVLGSDVCGEVVACGERVRSLRIGDKVFGAKPPSKLGTFAEYVSVDAEHLIKAPAGVKDEWLGAVPYTFLTAWAALVTSAGLQRENAQSLKVFVQGGAGGVGSMAVQLAKAWGAHVATTCHSNEAGIARSLGADIVIAYDQQDFTGLLRDYDVAVCAADAKEQDRIAGILKRHADATYVTVIHPTLALSDEHGPLIGPLKARRLKRGLDRAFRLHGRKIEWALFKPDALGLVELARLLSSGQLRPLIDRTVSLEQLAKAQASLERRVSRKIVVSIPGGRESRSAHSD